MEKAFRTARPRRVAVLAALGLALAGAMIGACFELAARAETARQAQIGLLHLEGDIRTMQTLPRTVQNASSLADVLTQLNNLGVRTQGEFARLARIGERDELAPAMKIDQQQLSFLFTEATFISQHRLLAAERLAASQERARDTEAALLARADREFSARAARADTIAEDAAIAAVLLAALICGLLFWRLVRSNTTAKSAQALAESVIESSPDGIFAFDRQRRYSLWSRANERITGISRGDVVGHLPTGTPVNIVAGALDAGDAALRGETVELHNVQLSASDLRDHVFDIVYGPLHDGTGRIVGGLGHLRDVTERNTLEEELRQAQKLEAIGQLAGGIAHDFNNLLMGIGGYASLALQRVPESDTILRHDLGEIEQATARARVLTEQLLFFARRRERGVEAVDLNGVVREATELLRRLIEPSVSIELDLHEPSWVSGDSAQLEQVLLNLGSNARDAMPDGGVLTIRTRAAGFGHVQLEVEDNGGGIPDDVKPHIFEPFFTTKDVGQGTGLGLASAYGIVTQSGGSIEVESTVGRGTKFTITLPAEAPALALPEPPPPCAPAVSGATATILLVDDEPVVRELIAAGLEGEGYTVIAKAAPADALAYVTGGGAFDFLITDVVMPGLSGGALVERIRSTVGHCFDTIYVSGYAASSIELDEQSVFLQKPFELAELYALVAGVLLERHEGVLGSGRDVARVAG